MSRQYDRPATLAALVNALVVFVLPVATVMVLMTVRSNGNGATVVGVDPDRAVALIHKLQMLGGYIAFMSPFAMAAAWRTFVHAKRWLEGTGSGTRGILEGALCGFAGATLVLLPGILTHPLQAPPYVITYGGLSAIVGLTIGVILWASAAAALKLMTLQKV